MKRSRILALAALLGVLASPRLYAQDVDSATYAYNFDVDSATATYCVLSGQNGAVLNAAPIAGLAPIKTTGSSTSVVAVTAGSNPFASLAAGDVLQVRRLDGTVDLRVITVKTDADTVTVDTAVNWDQTGGFAFSWLDLTCGTAATNGWLDVSGSADLTFIVQYEQGDLATSLDFRIECRGTSIGQAPIQVSPASGVTALTTANAGTLAGRASFSTSNTWGSCRVALIATGADASDAGANLERAVVSFIGRRLR